uniref:Glycoprotein IX platelet n=1 Tax=Leptobrachium leishanense TaxID=445787 RepID=A0A8C5QR38_9ANUR
MIRTNTSVFQTFILTSLLQTLFAEACPSSCSCTAIERKGIALNCSFRKLKALPEIPVNTIKLFLKNNDLTSVPPGYFDDLTYLDEVDLSSNPWHCDCGIFYVKIWLESQIIPKNIENVRCATPTTLSSVPIQNLSGNEIQGCQTSWPIECEEFFVRDLYLIGLAVILTIMIGNINSRTDTHSYYYRNIET